MAATKIEEVGLLLVHGIGEQKKLEHLRETGRELASYIAKTPGMRRLSVLDETTKEEPRIVIEVTMKDSARSAARQVRLNLHEVWWADLGISGGILTQIQFWLWGLGQWGAEAVFEGKRRSNTEQLMVLPKFAYQRSRQQRPSFIRRLPTHLILFGAALLAFLTFFTWSAAKRLIAFLSKKLPDPSLIFLFLGDVMIYERPVTPGHGTMEDPDLPIRTTIRRRVVSAITTMARGPYKRWYILAHSLGTVPAFNALQETEIALPNYLTKKEWDDLPAALKTSTPFVADKSTRDTDHMMPRRPPWLANTDGISRVALFERFQGFVTYGCPLDKFATLWPRIVPLNKQTAVFQPGCEWINLHEPTDPVAGCLDAFNAPPPDPQEKSPRKQLPPQNFASRSLWVFLLSHIYYFVPGRSKTRKMAAAVTAALLSPAKTSLSQSATEAKLKPVEARFRHVLAGVQILVLFALLLLAAGYLLILIRHAIACDFSTCELPSYWSWEELRKNVIVVIKADVAIVLLAGLIRIGTDFFRPHHSDRKNKA